MRITAGSTSRHTFSFAGYCDPRFMGFGPLRVISEDRVQPAPDFDTHSHRDMEIISYVLENASYEEYDNELSKYALFGLSLSGHPRAGEALRTLQQSPTPEQVQFRSEAGLGGHVIGLLMVVGGRVRMSASPTFSVDEGSAE